MSRHPFEEHRRLVELEHKKETEERVGKAIFFGTCWSVLMAFAIPALYHFSEIGNGTHWYDLGVHVACITIWALPIMALANYAIDGDE